MGSEYGVPDADNLDRRITKYKWWLIPMQVCKRNFLPLRRTLVIEENEVTSQFLHRLDNHAHIEPGGFCDMHLDPF